MKTKTTKMKELKDLVSWRPGVVKHPRKCECGATVQGTVAVACSDFRVVGCPECVKELSNK